MVSSAPRLSRRVMPNALRGVPRTVQGMRVLAGIAVAALLLAGLAGGLRRAGLDLPLVHAAGAHAALMIGGFFGTVIGIERAVALHTRWAWGAPVASAAGGLALAGGAWQAGAWLLVAGNLVFVAAGVEILRRQRAAHTAVLLLAALCGAGAALAWALGATGEGTLAAWLAFLVLTIAAERLEMTRLMRRRPGARTAFAAAVAGVLLSLPLFARDARAGGIVFGLALVALAAWLVRHDIARVTLGARGLSRYMAVALLAGYGWLGLGGVAWAATALGQPARDAALHAIGLGFVFSMVMAHAPVILPAIAGVKLEFDRSFYAPLAVLHASLGLRVLGGVLAPALLAPAALLNVLALAAFAATAVRAARRWRRLHVRRERAPR